MLLDELIRQVEKLIDMKVGDDSRLTSILQQLKRGNNLYSSDQKYVDSLISKYLFPMEERNAKISDDKISYSNDDALAILKNRLAKGEISLDEFNLKKKLIESDSVVQLKDEINEVNKKMEEMKKEQSKTIQNLAVGSYKNEGTATVLSFLLGIVGILGVGHMYAGRVGKGVGLLILGLFLIIVIAALSSAWSGILNCHYCGIPLENGLAALGSLVVFGIVYFVIWIWQIVDARKSCRLYNADIDKRVTI